MRRARTSGGETFRSIAFGIVLATIMGLGSNALRRPSLPLFQPLPDLYAGEIGLQKAHQMAAEEKVVFWDVRSLEAFQKAHIPGALSADQVPSREKIVVVYCSGRLCPKAGEAAEQLRSQGYQDVYVMPDGIKAWHSAGFPLYRSTE